MSNDDIRYLSVLLEEIRDQNKAVLEAIGDMQQNIAELPAIKQGIAELRQDMKVVKAAVVDVSHHITDHEHRISRLEAA